MNDPARCIDPRRLALLTFMGDTSHVPEFDEMLRLVRPQRDAYCQRHGYRHIVHAGPYCRDRWYYAVERLQFVRDLFAIGDLDLVWVLNVAAVITNLSIPVTRFVDDDRADVFITRAPNGLNAGSFILRRTVWCDQWLQYVIDRANGPLRDHYWHEQQAIIETEVEAGPFMRVLPHPSINQFRNHLHGWPSGEPQDWKPGDFVVHFPGQPLLARVSLVTEALAQVVE